MEENLGNSDRGIEVSTAEIPKRKRDIAQSCNAISTVEALTRYVELYGTFPCCTKKFDADILPHYSAV